MEGPRRREAAPESEAQKVSDRKPDPEITIEQTGDPDRWAREMSDAFREIVKRPREPIERKDLPDEPVYFTTEPPPSPSAETLRARVRAHMARNFFGTRAGLEHAARETAGLELTACEAFAVANEPGVVEIRATLADPETPSVAAALARNRIQAAIDAVVPAGIVARVFLAWPIGGRPGRPFMVGPG